MTQNGDPYENAIAERVNGILKYEFLWIDGFKDHLQAIAAIKQSIRIYNQDRPHLSCQMMTPDNTHNQRIIKRKLWNKKALKE
jgi:putative transposase